MFFDLLPCFKSIFHVKIQLFVTLKSDPVPDPRWFGSPGPDLQRVKKLDPVPH